MSIDDILKNPVEFSKLWYKTGNAQREKILDIFDTNQEKHDFILAMTVYHLFSDIDIYNNWKTAFTQSAGKILYQDYNKK